MPINWELITSELMETLGLEELITANGAKDCHAFASEITNALKDEERWNAAQLDGLRFAGQVLNMMLQHGNAAQPYGPMFVIDNTRSAIPDDFSRELLQRLVPWIDGLKDPELRSRFFDVTWVQGRVFAAATKAVESYIDSAKRLEHPENWTDYAKRIERALRLAAGLGKGGAALRDKVLDEIEAAVKRHNGADPLYLTLRLIGLLLEFKRGDAGSLGKIAIVAAQGRLNRADYWQAKDYFQCAADCFKAAGEEDARADALRSGARALASEAESAATPVGGRGATAGAAIMAQAVDAMRQAPDGKGAANVLHARLLELQGQAVAELGTFSTKTDISELVAQAREAVRGKPFHQAVFALCRMEKPPAIVGLKKQVEDEAKVAVMSTLFSSEIVNSRGRVVAKAPPLTHGEQSLDDDGLKFRMYRHARFGRNLAVQARLNPARFEILMEHTPSTQDIMSLVHHSPWIPPGHHESVVRALLAGFQGDMLVAAHLVPPHFEAMVRHVIELAGGSTAMFDPQGLQPEKSLNVLLRMNEAKSVFGEDAVFEFEDMFTDQLGTNLRNEIAHGLISDEGMFSSEALYAWWLLLRYCVLSSAAAVTSPTGAAGDYKPE